MKRVAVPILNPDKDMSAAHAFDGNRLLPREIVDPNCELIPWGEHPDDDRFITVEITSVTTDAADGGRCSECDAALVFVNYCADCGLSF